MQAFRSIFFIREPDKSWGKDAISKGLVTIAGGATAGLGIHAAIEWAASKITLENTKACVNLTAAALVQFQEAMGNWTQTCIPEGPPGQASCNISTMPKYVDPNCPDKEADFNTLLLCMGLLTVVGGYAMLRSAIVSYDHAAEQAKYELID